jgi:tetratricopeptide (TPR) repeat protein
VANEQRRKADARSADLRQLSNSLLSELDEAIKQLPGSTGAQKLLVTRVLEHLDRMAGDAKGDRDTQLDLADAYSRLASLQGDPYFQNLGDPDGGLTSVGKAVALAQPLVTSNPNDNQALQSLATAQETRSEILFGIGKTPDAVASMQAAVRAYDRLIAPKDAPVALIGEVAAVYGPLGDELGQSGTASLGDKGAALAAYRKTIELDHRALSIDPNFIRPKRGLAIMQMKIGSVELENDPAQALKDFQLALTQADALPEKEKSTLSMIRLRSMIERKEANALEETGRYADSLALFAKVRADQQKLADQDPQDLRALVDLQVVLNDLAGSYEDAAGTDLGISRTKQEQDKNELAAQEVYAQTITIFDRMIKLDPSNVNWRAQQAFTQVKVGTMALQLHQPGDGSAMSRKGLAALKELAAKPDASVMILDYALNSALDVEPEDLRDPAFAVACAEREVALGQRQTASAFLALARAYHAAGQAGKAEAAAREGLALLPTYHAGEVKGRMRKLLEQQLHP